MATEQALIQELYQFMQSQHLQHQSQLYDIAQRVENSFPNSYVLHFYLGMAYERYLDDAHTAGQHYARSIRLKPSFAEPVFQLAGLLLQEAPRLRFHEAEQLLLAIFDTNTLDPTSPSGAKVYNPMHQLRICSMLVPEYDKTNDSKKLQRMAKVIFELVEKRTPKSQIGYRHVEIYKNLCFTLGHRAGKLGDMLAAHDYYVRGLGLGLNATTVAALPLAEESTLHKIELSLLQGYSLSQHYIQKPAFTPSAMSCMVNAMYERYRAYVTILDHKDTDDKAKIKIGYLSPDFNKNAVGLFVTALLKHHDPERFEVHVYYDAEHGDAFTDMFRDWQGQGCYSSWNDVNHMSDDDLYKLMALEHQLDVLVDLSGHGVGNRMTLLAKAPAPKIINYLGYPDRVYLKEVTHRITDAIADPPTTSSPATAADVIGETLLRLPRCFVCYTKFEVVPDVSIDHKTDNHLCRIGIMNRLDKYDESVRKAWKSILQRDKRAVLCFKMGTEHESPEALYKQLPGFPRQQIEILPFAERLEQYLELYNRFDFCMDTYPYSGTTTTCSSLYMGVPVFTVYTPAKGRHVSNVSASIMLHTNREEYDKRYVCASMGSYVDQVCKEIDRILRKKPHQDAPNENDVRTRRRADFMRCMDPVAFMRDFEAILMS